MIKTTESSSPALPDTGAPGASSTGSGVGARVSGGAAGDPANGGPNTVAAGAEPSGARYLEWLKVVFTGSAVLAFLIAFGFLSETAAFQYLGLPQLQSDTVEMAEQGGRNLIDSFGALGLERGASLLGLALAVMALWWARDRKGWIHKSLTSLLALKVAQVGLLLVLLAALASLVDLRTVTTADGPERLAEREQEIRRYHRHRPNWDPRQEFARIEALDFEVGTVRLGCRLLERLTPDTFNWWSDVEPGPWVTTGWAAWWFDGHCFTARDYTTHPARAGAAAAPDGPQLGIGRRKTAEAREAARDAFGNLFAALLILILLVYLTFAWRRWLQRKFESSEKLAHSSSPSLESPHQGFFDASERLVEPLIAMLLLLSIGLLPSAYGVLASGKVGIQQVMVRLKNEAVVDDVPCTAIATQVPATGGGVASAGEGNGEERREAAEPDWQLLTCSRFELDAIDALLTSYQEAWRDLYQVRPGDDDEYSPKLDSLRAATDAVIAQVGSGRCPEAFARLWRALPREAEFSTRLEAAQYVWERWTELQRTRSMVRFGHIVTHPRGEHSDRLLIADELSKPTAGGPLRVALRAVPLACAESIEPMPDLEEEAIRETVDRIYAGDTERIGDFQRNPGKRALRAMLGIWRHRVIPKVHLGVLATQIGTQAARLREADPLLYAEAVDELARTARSGLCVLRGSLSVPAFDPMEGGAAEQEAQGRAGAGAQWNEQLANACGISEGVMHQLAEEATTAATSLQLAGGPWATESVADLICSELGQEGDHAQCQHGSQRWQRARVVDAALTNQIGTLVTAAGYLAQDAEAELRDLPPEDACREGRGEVSWNCENRVAQAALTLDTFLRAVAAGRGVEGKSTVAHSIGNRRAACTSLGLSGSASAGEYLQDVLPQLFESENEILIGSCLIQLPQTLGEPIRTILSGLVRGRWPEAPKPASPKAIASPPLMIRTLALEQLFEAGLFFEDELLFASLNDPVREIRNLASRLLEDVEPVRLVERLWSCATGRGESAAFGGTEESMRCLRALTLVKNSEDGDNGLALRLVQVLRDSRASDAVSNEVCAVLHELAARDGKDARSWLRQDGKAICGTDPLEGLSEIERWNAQVDTFETSPPDSTTARRRTEVGTGESPTHPLGESQDDSDEDAWATRLRALVLDARLGEPAALSELIELVSTQRGEKREQAYVSLSLVGFEYAAALAVGLLQEPPPTWLTYRAAQYLEDGTGDRIALDLASCFANHSLSEAVRGRCALGLALTARGYVPESSVTEALRAKSQYPALHRPVCVALHEVAVRGGIAAPEECSSLATEIPEDTDLRWRFVLGELVETLITERERSGPLAGESTETHHAEMERLRSVLSELERR